MVVVDGSGTRQNRHQGTHNQSALDDPFALNRVFYCTSKQNGEHDVGECQPVARIKQEWIPSLGFLQTCDSSQYEPVKFTGGNPITLHEVISVIISRKEVFLTYRKSGDM